jgi:sigma-B regulation protein RsbU (phosphoserine phosphatase)
MPTLTIQSGLLKGQQFRIDRTTVIGRGATADVSLADPGVSRRHASLQRQEGGWVVEDLGSANGTTVNRRRVSEPTRLQDADVIGVGSVFAAFTDDAPAGARAEGPAVQYRDEGPPPAVLISLPGDKAAGDPSAASMDESVRLRFLADFARIGTLVFDEPALVAFIADELLALVPRADRSIVLTCEHGELVPRASRTRSGQTTEIVASRQLLRDVMARREAVLAIDTLADERYAESESILALGIRAAICAPMMFQGEIYGVVQVDSQSPGVPFKEADVALVLSLASQLGMALGYARLHATLVERELIERDIALARRIQQQFLPAGRLEMPGYTIAVEYRPALGVSGDFYDLIELQGGRVALVAGDVSGKGVSAALYASKLTTDLRYQTAGQTQPGEILVRTNRILASRDHEGMFATLAVVVIAPEAGTIELANAGHPLPFVRRRDGRVTALGRAGGSPLGLDPDASFQQVHCDLLPGDALVLYTDGVIEALNVKQELFDEARTIEAIRKSDGTVDGILASLRTAIDAFIGRAPQSDDVTMVCLRRER